MAAQPAPVIVRPAATFRGTRGLKARLGAFLRWQAESGSHSAEVLGELAALRQEVASLQQQVAELGAARPETQRPYFYFGNGIGLTKLSAGHPFFVNTRDRGITTWIALGGVWETFVDEVLCALARPGQVVIDVGANQGYYTVKLGHLVGETGRVFSFEPNPELYPFLADNVSINGLAQRVKTYRLAAGDAPGRSVLHFPYSNMGGGFVDVPGGAAAPQADIGDGGTASVEIARIDDILPAGTVADLIKIDAEGFEPLVLRGMGETLARSPDAAIVVEVSVAAWARFGEPMALLEQARGARDAYWIGHDGRLTPLTLDQIAGRLSADFVSYVLLLPPERAETVARFVG